MSRLQNAWRVAAKDLDLEVVIPFVLKTDTFSLTAEVLLKNFGSENGMLIVSDYSVIKAHRDQVIKCGYGFATLTEPERDWPFTDEEREAFIEMLGDWQWSGDPEQMPEWLDLEPEEN